MNLQIFFCSFLVSIIGWAELAAQTPQELPTEQVRFDEKKLQRVEELVLQGIQDGKMPGCVVCFGSREKISYLRAFGNKQVQPEPIAMTVDTVFDLASLTKPVATGTSIMKLVEQGHLRLGSKVVDFFPEFGVNGKDKITLQDLLIHQSGLTPDNSLKDYLEGPDIAWKKICELSLVDPVGTTFKYSDVNFIVLAKIIEKVSGQNVRQFSQAHLFQPLQMKETGYVPGEPLRLRAAPTEQRDGKWIRGEVHDPRAHELEGIAGHAGLFSTAADLARYASMMLGQGTFQSAGESAVQVLNERTVRVMTRGYSVSSGQRGLSWDRRTGYSSNRGDLLSDAAFGHGGFTGTVLWIDPEQDFFFIFLSNRLHPDGKGNVNPLVGQIVNAVVGAMRPAPSKEASLKKTPVTSEVLTGLDVLERDGFRQLAGRRIGLITNHTGRNAEGVGIVKLLHDHPEVKLQVLFSSEHGFDGKLDTARVDDGKEQGTGLQIYSLYGETRRPTKAMCESVDTLVFDIQDIGTRFYTYISTMGECMKAANEFNLRFVVLDRPNPIGGVEVAGPMLDPGSESFVAFHSLPVRHGMTSGEIARMLKAELKLQLDLQVIACEGWSREQLYDAAGLTWVNPSPNMRGLTAALLYPGVGLLETTNLSVGRGMDTPFEIVGAPWINGRQLAAELNRLEIVGVSFTPVEFTPTSSKFEGQLCQGVRITITDRSCFKPLPVGFALATTLRKLYPNEWQVEHFRKLLGNRVCFEAVVNGKSLEEVLELSQAGLSDFLRRREAFLLYR
jgi:uncharacterized protein YbbC (DUF1343 family)/CubicO group peptidase (beta-lactamase class C family)